MTTELIAELTRLDGEATSGPWHAANWTKDGCIVFDCEGIDLAEVTWDAEPNAALIVAMRNALPEILKALEREKRLASVAHAILNFRLAYGATSTVCNEDVGDLLQEVCNMAREALENLNDK